jgi:hypothetical protein
MPAIRFNGNCPGNVARDAKYSIKSIKDKKIFGVGVEYIAGGGERWHPCIDNHPVLVEMVNAIKLELAGIPGGAFYINEYRQVIVPVTEAGTSVYYYAGEYASDLIFDFEGKQISGRPLSLAGTPLRPGDRWEGVHPGISYVLRAGATDIYYEVDVKPGVTRRGMLSQKIGVSNAREAVQIVANIKGHQGGRFYVNELRQIFTPLELNNQLEYIYVGALPEPGKWFPKPVI